MVALSLAKPNDLTAQALPSSFINLSTMLDFAEPRTINLFKQARPWADNAGAYTSDQLVAGGYVTPGGSIVSLPTGVTTLLTYLMIVNLDGFTATTNMTYLSDSFTLTYDGQATIVVGGTGLSAIVYTAGQVTFSFDATVAGAYIYLTCAPTNPANWPRNWKCTPAAHAANYAAGKIYRQNMLTDCLGPYLGPRLMDFGETNFNPLVNWSSRPLLTDEYWTGRIVDQYSAYHRTGLPLEALIAVCAEAGKHGWFNVPAYANDTYVTNMATLLRDTFPTNKKIFVEYSNETWNGIFSQTTYANAQAVALWGSGDANDWTAYRSTQIMGIFRSVFAGQLGRLRGVMATQTVATSVTYQRLAALKWQAAAAQGMWVDPKTVHQYLAVTGYFGNTTLADNASAIMTALATSQATAVTAIIATYCPAAVAATKSVLSDQITIARAAGMKCCMYENNQHLNLEQASATTLYSGGSPAAGTVAMMDAVYNDSRLEAHKKGIRDSFKANGGAFDCIFADYGGSNRYGGWYIKKYVGNTTTQSAGMASWMTSNPQWFHL